MLYVKLFMMKGVGNHSGEIGLLGTLGTALGLRLPCVRRLEDGVVGDTSDEN